MDFNEMCSFENLYKAHIKARKSKRNRSDVINFENNLGFNLLGIRSDLMNGMYRPRPYKKFIIHDPKTREIHALDYRDRIVQHTLCDNVIEPFMERHLIYDNAASRSGKGTDFARKRLKKFLHEYYLKNGSNGYILKFDVRKYYDSIDHDILKKLFHDAFSRTESSGKVTDVIDIFIDSYETTHGKGIPLGNQTSGWFALYYLDGLDRLIKEKLRIKYYTRYMDDGMIIHEDREFLKNVLKEMSAYIREARKLEFNQKTVIAPISQGCDYLGFHFYMNGDGKVIMKLRSGNKRRMKRRVKRFRHAYRMGKMTEEDVGRSMASYMGHLSHGNTYHLQQNIKEHMFLSKSTKLSEEEKEKLVREYKPDAGTLLLQEWDEIYRTKHADKHEKDRQRTDDI